MSNSVANRLLIILIPCFNERDSLPIAVKALPAFVPGYDRVEILVIDDGSIDGTGDVARKLGVQHIVTLTHSGLGPTYVEGVKAALALGAHTIVIFDADNQYRADDIGVLIQPIVDGACGFVIGTRPVQSIKHFSPLKKFFHRFGNRVIRVLSRTQVEDVCSGFRAMRYDVAAQLQVRSKYSYTMETVIQAGIYKIPMVCVPIRVNEGQLRPSRLMKSMAQYLWRSADIIVRSLIYYRLHKPDNRK